MLTFKIMLGLIALCGLTAVAVSDIYDTKLHEKKKQIAILESKLEEKTHECSTVKHQLEMYQNAFNDTFDELKRMQEKYRS